MKTINKLVFLFVSMCAGVITPSAFANNQIDCSNSPAPNACADYNDAVANTSVCDEYPLSKQCEEAQEELDKAEEHLDLVHGEAIKWGTIALNERGVFINPGFKNYVRNQIEMNEALEKLGMPTADLPWSPEDLDAPTVGE